MENSSIQSSIDNRTVDFGNVPVDCTSEKVIMLENNWEKVLTYRVSLLYIMNNIDQAFKVTLSSSSVAPHDCLSIIINFKPRVSGQSYTEYYLVDDILGNTYKLTVTGNSFGPNVKINMRKIEFRICKNVSEQRKQIIKIINKSSIDAPYQWLLPFTGHEFFQISTGNCGVIRGFETITATVLFTGTSLGVYASELVCLVLHQDPIFLNIIAVVMLSGIPMCNINDHIFEKRWKSKQRSAYLMENSLRQLNYIPAASCFERFLDFGTGSATDWTLNVSQTLCVTNHQDEDAPNAESEAFSFLLCGDCQHKTYGDDNLTVKLKHTWFRIPCIGNTWPPCTEWTTEWDCPIELGIPMHFKFQAPPDTNYVVMPMCGIVQGRGWQIITVAFEPTKFGEYCESWDLIVNMYQKACINFFGNAEVSQIEVTSHGYNPETHAMLEFPSTITGCTNYCTSYLHNLTRMSIHMRVLNNVPWLGADNNGWIVLAPKEIVNFHWWFFPKENNRVYDTIVTVSCICIIGDRPVGTPTEVFIHISGFSELPDLRVLPKSTNLHDCVVDESKVLSITLYNYGSCYFTSKLYYKLEGMGTSRMKWMRYSLLGKPFVLFGMMVKRTISVKCPIILSNHCVWNILNVEEPNVPLNVSLYAPDLCYRTEPVELILPDAPVLLHMKLQYTMEGKNTLCYILSLPNNRTINIFVKINTHCKSKGILTPLRRNVQDTEYLSILDCGRVPINNLDPVIRIVWLYNPTDVFTTWRLLQGNAITPNAVIRCLQYFAEVPPSDKLAVPFAFLPMEMVDYEVVFLCSFGYDIVKILVKGQGGLPNCVETRLDIPYYIERTIRSAYTEKVGINDFPPYVLDLKKPQPTYLALTVSVSSKGQRDGCTRLLTPPYDLLSSDFNEYGLGSGSSGNNMTVPDIIRIIDGILWDALHSKMFKYHVEYYSKEDIPTYTQLVKIMESDAQPRLSRRVTSGICDAIINKAIFHIYNLNSKREVSIFEAE
ncbi:unnamed protein product [Leptidea sinapis]|uniref:Coiled-coil domain-containing protein 108 n=1 Tax=Leptidea sinapis TaxID=189913 RepID=A0A5E4Q344_9NEOP|nr:unnamed protein product [Leptidea sinapis]